MKTKTEKMKTLRVQVMILACLSATKSVVEVDMVSQHESTIPAATAE